ncbi:hypothetical protein FOL47_011165 [Perkinsus chesapeaki]|uniref:Uncharacterized protein n=1 Tax=Perkinsus chesapeaki TaxID=330153 RepID=A0A7J6MNJ3_PERCH|nr:hypothetical protein FOL47_011165 [Perkinsus chesapeaki]
MSSPSYYEQRQSGPSYAPPNVYCPRVPPRSYRQARQAVHGARSVHHYSQGRPPIDHGGQVPYPGSMQYNGSYPSYGNPPLTTYTSASAYGMDGYHNSLGFEDGQPFEQYDVGYGSSDVRDADRTAQRCAEWPTAVPHEPRDYRDMRHNVDNDSIQEPGFQGGAGYGREHSRHRGHADRRERHRGSDGGYRDHVRRQRRRSSHHRRRRSRDDRSSSPAHSRRPRRDGRRERYGSGRPSGRVDSHRRRCDSTERRERHTSSTRHLSRRGEDFIKELVDIPDASIERVVTYVTDTHGNEYRLQIDHKKSGTIPSASTSASSSKIYSPTTPSYRLQAARVVEEADISGYSPPEPYHYPVEPPAAYAPPRRNGWCNRYSPQAQEIIAAIESRHRWEEDAGLPHHHAEPQCSVADLRLSDNASGKVPLKSQEPRAAPVIVNADDYGSAEASFMWRRIPKDDEGSFGHISSLYDDMASEVDPAEKEQNLVELEATVMNFTSAIDVGDASAVDSKPRSDEAENSAEPVNENCSGEKGSLIVEDSASPNTEYDAKQYGASTEVVEPRCSIDGLHSVVEEMATLGTEAVMEQQSRSTVVETMSSPRTQATSERGNSATFDKEAVLAPAALHGSSAAETVDLRLTKEAITKELLPNDDGTGSDSAVFNSPRGAPDDVSDRDRRDRAASCTVSEDYFTAPSLADSDDLVASKESVDERLNRLLVLNDPTARLGAPMHNHDRNTGKGGRSRRRRKKDRR